jgi:hypothetical protein
VLLAYEGFNYANSGASQLAGANGGGGWGGPWAVTTLGSGFTMSQDDTSLNSASFTHPTQGDRALAAGAGSGSNVMRIYRPLQNSFDLGNDGALYASFMFQKNGSSTATSNNNMEFNLTQGDSGNGAVRFGSSSTNGFFIWDGTSVGSTFESVVLDQTYFVVIKVGAHESSNDEASVMIFSPTETVPTAEPATWDSVRSFNSTAVIDRIRLWIGNVATGQFDEIRLGTSWAAVTGLLAGDFNRDGSVDTADYIVWRNTNSGNQQTYLEWRSHFGERITIEYEEGEGSLGGLGVPEPAGLALVIVGCAAVWLQSGARKRFNGLSSSQVDG